MLIVKSAYLFNLSYPQKNDFGDLLGTLYAPVSKIAPVKVKVMGSNPGYFLKSFLLYHASGSFQQS